MAQETTQDGLTGEQIESTYAVLEVLRENFKNDDMGDLAAIVNEAHYLTQHYDDSAIWSPDYDLPEPGDIMVDPESDPRFGSGDVVVADVVHCEAHEYYVEKPNRDIPLSRLNPGHPANAPVVIARYIDGSDKKYAFPVTRLQEK